MNNTYVRIIHLKEKIINKNKIQTFKKRITCVIFNDHNNIQTKSKLGQLLLHLT